jgi:hypothetical protein
LGLHDISLGEDLGDGCRLDAKTDLDPGGGFGVRRGGTARHLHDLIEQVLKVGPAFLEAAGGDIGQVVGNDVHVHVLGRHTGG